MIKLNINSNWDNHYNRGTYYSPNTTITKKLT